MKRNNKFAKEAAETYASIFAPDRFFIEVPEARHQERQDQVNPELADSRQANSGVGLVANERRPLPEKRRPLRSRRVCAASAWAGS